MNCSVLSVIKNMNSAMADDLTDILIRLVKCYHRGDLEDMLIEKGVDDEFLKRFSNFVDKIETGSKPVLTFRDRSKYRLRKAYILSWYDGITEEGVPFITINDFPLGLKGDKNPVINLCLQYDTIEDRDYDLEILQLAL